MLYRGLLVSNLNQIELDHPGLLVVALKLLGLVVAVLLALPGAVKETVSLRSDVLVQGMVSGRLSFVSLSASCIGLGKRGSIFHLGYGVFVKVLWHHGKFSVSKIEPVRR